MIVEQCMSKSPRCCTPGDTLSTVARMLWEHDLGALPVVDHAGALVGMITDRDLCMAAYTSGLPLHGSHVARHMSKTVFSIGAKADAGKAAELMRSRHVRRVPVVENGKLVGMVTLSDLARTAGKNGKHKGLAHDEVVGVLRSVTTPRAPATTNGMHTSGASSETVPAPLPKRRKVKALIQPKPRTLAKRR